MYQNEDFNIDGLSEEDAVAKLRKTIVKYRTEEFLPLWPFLDDCEIRIEKFEEVMAEKKLQEMRKEMGQLTSEADLRNHYVKMKTFLREEIALNRKNKQKMEDVLKALLQIEKQYGYKIGE